MLIDNEDYGYELMRQKRIDDMDAQEFFRVFNSIRALDEKSDIDQMDKELKTLEAKEKNHA